MAIVRRNERSWAIDMISEMNRMLDHMDLKIKKAGGESTISDRGISMFPDVLLYADESKSEILQGWELKMPDVSITDEVFISDATRKARALQLNSFVIWNFSYAKLYLENDVGNFEEVQVWNGTSHIQTREDVYTYRMEWMPLMEEILLTVNRFLLDGTITIPSLFQVIPDSLMSELIVRNKPLVADYLLIETSRNMTMERWLDTWWRRFRNEYEQDEPDMYQAYAKAILSNWANRITFANAIKSYHACAFDVNQIAEGTTPQEGNAIFEQMIRQGDYYHIFGKITYNEEIPEDTWVDIAHYNQFLIESKMEKIDQSELQGLLETTVNTAKREIRGQYATPYVLANLLCQITVLDWGRDCADLCAGTGTIAKALIDNKRRRLKNPADCFSSTWISDKYAYPLQIANIALTDITEINMLAHIFQSDVFEVETGRQIMEKSPLDGSDVCSTIPPFGAIVSNLPFVAYNNIAEDERVYLNAWRERIKQDTGIAFTSGKTDLYNYIPFKLYELLADDGRLGIIVSNSWLGTEIGRKFFEALQYYYAIQSVVASGRERWFYNADVMATILVLQKKPLSSPDKETVVDFWLLQKSIYALEEQETEDVISSIVLRQELNGDVIALRQYSIAAMESFMEKGICMNALFQDLFWFEQMQDALVPITDIFDVRRGERRGWNDLFYPQSDHQMEPEYIVPVLKDPTHLQSYMAETDKEAFCCHRSKAELQQLQHLGAWNWITRFERVRNGSGKLLPEALRQSNAYWYEMKDDARADFVTALNPDQRLFVARFTDRTFVDQRFTRLMLRNQKYSAELLHALLNSLYGMFAIESIGFGRALGVLDASSTKFKRICMINPDKISKSDAEEILSLFDKIRSRKVLCTEDELKDADRKKFDLKVLQAVGHEDLYEPICNTLLHMQRMRRRNRSAAEPQDKENLRDRAYLEQIVRRINDGTAHLAEHDLIEDV